MLSAKQVASGQSAEVEVSLKPENATAILKISKTVTVSTNDPRQPQITLAVSASVEPEFVYDTSVYFGKVPRGKEVTKEITIEVPGKSFKLLSAESSDPNVSVRLQAVPGTDGRKFRLIATQKGDAKEGYHFGAVTIKTTSASTPVLTVGVRGTVAGQ